MKVSEMKKVISKIMVKHNIDTYYLTARLGLLLGIECVTLSKDGIKGIDFEERYVSIKSKDVKSIYDDIRKELREVHLDELSEREVAKLEKQIVKGSVFMSDYENTFGVKPEEVFNYADGYLEAKENPEEYGDYETFYDYICSIERVD